MRAIIALALAAFTAAGACTAAASPQPSVSSPVSSPSTQPSLSAEPSASAAPQLVLRTAPPDLGCDTIGWEGEPYHTLTFRIDPTAAEHVTAVSDTGVQLMTFWSAGFVPGTITERVIRDPAGQVVARDGEVLAVPAAAFPELHGYFVCLSPTKLYVLLTKPS